MDLTGSAGACRKLAGKVAAPVIKEGDDARLALARYRAALASANYRLGATSGCITTLVQKFAG